MNKMNLVDYVAANANLKKKDAELAVTAVLDGIATALKEGDKVQISSFGTFKIKEKAERKGRNPRTKEEIIIPACKVPSFVPGKALKDSVQ